MNEFADLPMHRDVQVARHAELDGMRPPATVLACSVCRAFYVDDPQGRRAHLVVMGHQPRGGEHGQG